MRTSCRWALVLSGFSAWSVCAATHYVWQGSPGPTPPYTNWVTAAANIQDAVDAAVAGDVVLVTNGTYGTGNYLYRVRVGKPLTLQSVNGPQATVIDGGRAFGCVSLANGASLFGFTLANGVATFGGGVYCQSTSAVLSNCVLTGNVANGLDAFGGGACFSTLFNCTLTGNWSSWVGGGAGTGVPGGGCILNNCTLTGNSAEYGGGAQGATLNNCTLTGNSGGGAIGATLNNCIAYFNTSSGGRDNYDLCTLNYCCTTPLPPNGVGNITNAPLFVGCANGNLRLQSNSPCINAGSNAYVTTTTDLDGRPRIVGGTVDMGAYESQPGVSGAFIGWLRQYGLPTDGSPDYADPDQDGLNNWQEWVCGTNPTNALSVLRMVSALPAGTSATVTWQSVAGGTYFIQRSTNLTSSFTLLATNIVGQSGTTSYADTNATGTGPVFYRVVVKSP